jgi:hypothetical protein
VKGITLHYLRSFDGFFEPNPPRLSLDPLFTFVLCFGLQEHGRSAIPAPTVVSASAVFPFNFALGRNFSIHSCSPFPSLSIGALFFFSSLAVSSG